MGSDSPFFSLFAGLSLAAVVGSVVFYFVSDKQLAEMIMLVSFGCLAASVLIEMMVDKVSGRHWHWARPFKIAMAFSFLAGGLFWLTGRTREAWIAVLLALAIMGFLFLALVTEDFQEIPGRSEDSDDDT